MSIGQDPEAFWRTTPRVLALVFAGATERFQREHQGRAWQAWHTAALSRCDPKKFPTLDDLMGVKRKVRRQTVSEMDAIFRAWAAKG